jgi:hypothetical protein
VRAGAVASLKASQQLGVGFLVKLGEVLYGYLGREISVNIEGFIRSSKSFSDFFEKAKELTNKERGDAFERVAQLIASRAITVSNSA